MHAICVVLPKLFWTYIDSCNVCHSLPLGTSAYLPTLILCPSSSNRSFTRLSFGWHGMYCRLWINGSPPSCCTVSPHNNCMNFKIDLETVIQRVLWCSWRTRWSELTDILGGHGWVCLETLFKAVIKHVWRYTWTPWLRKVGGHELTSYKIQMEEMIKWI